MLRKDGLEISTVIGTASYIAGKNGGVNPQTPYCSSARN